MRKRVKQIFSVVLSMIMIISMVQIQKGVTVLGATNPYPTTQDWDGDGYYEVPCTRFAWQQVYDNLGIALPGWGNAGTWLDHAKNAGISTGTVAKPGSVAVWVGDGAGHVAYVTSALGNTFTVNEGGRTDLDTTSSHGVAYGYTLTNAVGGSRPYDSGKTLVGFIYPGVTDTTPPSYSNFYVGELREGAFTILANVTDSSGIQSVKYAVWSDLNGQDDIVWYTGNCTDGNDWYWARVNFSEHNGERGNYIIHMYITDGAGNEHAAGILYYFDEEAPVISDVVVSDVSASGYTVTCTVTDELSINRVQFPTWTLANSQDDLDLYWKTNGAYQGTNNGNIYTYRVNTSEHNNETGMYGTHIYAYDLLGNSTCYIVPDVNVHNHEWSSGRITKFPTTLEEGSVEYVCGVCDCVKTESIARVEETTAEITTDETTTQENQTVERETTTKEVVTQSETTTQEKQVVENETTKKIKRM